MMKYINIKISVLSIICLFFCVACDTNEPSYQYTPSTQNTTSSKISKPTFEKYLTTTTTTGFSIRMRFDNGGDDRSNMSCVVYWKRFTSKPSKTPAKSELANAEDMRIYGSTTKTTTFDKSHEGYNGGNYIYYYTKCSNSKYSTTTNVTYCIIKR